MNMIEKMATAMRGADRIDPVDQDYYIALARAALQAIREPDEAMLRAAEEVLDLPHEEPMWRRKQNAGEAFSAMIDHILSEGEGK